MANCAKCGQPLREGARFCGACGAKAEGELSRGRRGTLADTFAPTADQARLPEPDPKYFEFEVVPGDGRYITKYTGPSTGHIVLPAYINDQRIDGLSHLAFQGSRDLRHITIPMEIATISGGSFRDCVDLSTVDLSGGIHTINAHTFENCTGLRGITLPESVTHIYESAFCGSGLIDITIPRSVTYIGDSAFASCHDLTRVIILGNVEFGREVFYDCGSLTIHAPAGSTAERYARENNIPFRPL